MNTSTEAIKQLEASLASTRQAADTIANLIAVHDYQDVAALVTQAAATMLECATLLMQKDDVAAIEALENAEDLIDAIYDIIDSDTED